MNVNINIPDGWSVCEFDKIVSLSKKKYAPLSSEHHKCLELEHFEKETGRLNGYVDSALQSSIKNCFQCGDVLFGKLRPYLKKYTLANFDGVCSTEIWVLRGCKEKLSNPYLYLIVQTNKFNTICNVSTGTHMPRADWEYVSSVPFAIPPLPEQEKIAEILSCWDEGIEKLSALIEKKKLLKKGLMQQLLTGKHRLKGFTQPWIDVEFGDVFIVEKGIKKHQIQTKDYAKKGLFPVIDQGKDKVSAYCNFSDKLYTKNPVIVFGDHTRVIKYIDFPFVVGADGTQVLNSLQIADLCFCFYMLENTKIQNLGYSRHLSILKEKIFMIPSDISEQKAIAGILSKADEEIELLNKQLENLKIQKKGLMQQLLTGKTRVKVN